VPAADAAVPRTHNQPPPVTLDDDQVLTFDQWVKLNALSVRTGRRILASGEGPTITQLSQYRIGITRAANRRWQASRARRVTATEVA
jgi:hypothetical protein